MPNQSNTKPISPTLKMCAEWKPHYDPQVIIQAIDDLQVPNGQQVYHAYSKEDYNTVFQGFKIDELFVLLHSAIKFRTSMPERFKLGIVQKAVFEAADQDKLSVDSVLQEVSDLETEYAKQVKERYTILSSLSLKHRSFLNRVTWGGNSITFNDSYPPEIKQTEAWEKVNFQFRDKWPERYTQIRVFVDARNIHEAADAVFDFIDLVRGIWNYYFNSKKRSRKSFSVGNHKPVNSIVTGPLHVIRDAGNRYWYTPNYLGPIKCLDLKGDWTGLKQFERKIRRRIRKSNYPEDLKDAFRRYVRALDERDLNTSFLKLWSLLELLTNTQKQSYRETRRRAAFPWSDDSLLDQTLIQLHEYRNATVHTGFEHSEVESLLYQLKLVVEKLIEFHLAYGNEYSSIGSLAEFLSHPRDISVLKSKIETLNKALNYHEPS